MGTTALIKLKHTNYDILSSKYDLQGICGKSHVATVFYGIRKDINYKVAIKQINLKRVINQTSNVNLLLTELQVIKILSKHDFIVNVHSGFHLQTHCYLVQECLTGGDLRDHIRYGEIMSEKSVAYIIACIGSALNHMHKNGIIHRDIKPENIVFDQFFRPKLVDFGISMISNSIIPLSVNTSGTLPYVAPEVLAVHHYHSTHSDFWSLGLIAYELIYHQLPFKRHCPPEFVSFVSNKYYNMWQNVLKYNDKYSYHQVFNGNYSYSNNSNRNIINNNNSNTNIDNIDNNNHNNLDNIQELPYPIVDDETFTNITKFPFIDITQPLPPGLKIQLPSTRIFDGKIISDDCLSMLEGLLTILIPQRLGSVHQFELFTNHSWFRTHGFDAFNKLGELESPLMFEHPYYWQVHHICDEDLIEINEEINNDPIFTPEIKRKLIAYYYGSETYEPMSQEEYYPDTLRTDEDKLSQPFSSPIATTPLTATHQFA